jgi:glyoxylase-like metal-dependent hydrolase (beta-lactamase superfamily II)
VLPLEDNWSDVIGKARRGLGLSHGEVARRADCEEARIREWESGHGLPDEEKLIHLAKALGLAMEPLAELALKKWKPDPVRTAHVRNFIQVPSHYGDMVVSAYLAWDPATHEAALFDTGTEMKALSKALDSHRLKLKYLFLTHAHPDHVALVDEIKESWNPEMFTSKGEFVRGAKKVAEGDSFRLGRVGIEVLETEGHSPGGLTYVLRHLYDHAPAVAVVGDALFAASVGGPNHSYEKLLGNIRQKILSLPDDTVLAPGHGPLTTVGEEKAHNPFLA